MKLITNKEFFNRERVIKDYKEWNNSNNSITNKKIIHSLNPYSDVLVLGCGAGRVVKELKKFNHNITAIDIAENMIISSKQIEPRARYYCKDAVEFVRDMKNDLKFDYILGLYTFLNYINKEDIKQFINNLKKMLKPEGEIIFDVRYMGEHFKDTIKSFLSPFFCLYYNWRFGDIYSRTPDGEITFGHLFTKNQLRRLSDCEINKSVVRIK